jgi:predicted PurR-regulated permease PerM
VAVLLAIAWHIRDVLLLIYVAALFAVVIGPAVSFIQSWSIRGWHPGRGLAVLSIMLGVVLTLTVLIVFIAPPIVRDMQSFTSDLPQKVHTVQAKVQGLPFADRLNPDALQRYAADAIGGVFGLFAGIAGGLLGFVSWLVLTVYFVIDGERAVGWGLSFFPLFQRGRIRKTLERAEHRVSRWLIGQLMLMVILGVASAITFRLLHVRYPLALGLFAGLMNIVPIVGPLAAATLATTVAVFDSWNKAAGVLIFYVVYQQVENAFLTPKIMKTTVDLPALAVIIALAIGAKLAGVIGALVAVPTAALIGVIIDEYLVQGIPRPASSDEN